MEWDCWWKISMARHTQQSLLWARDEGKVAGPCPSILLVATFQNCRLLFVTYTCETV